MIGAGALDRRITIGREMSPGRDPVYNSPLPPEFVPIYPDTPATVREVSGREFVENNGQYASKLAVFTVRWLPDVKVTDTVRYGGRDFNVKDTREIGRRRFLEIHAEAVA